MDEEQYLHRFGTPLNPIQKDEVPAKKPLAIEDQIVKDENGKRRFHGAFTGGFSAGFWNTVGSLEGWTPQQFKSSRGEKATKVQQRPEDFMDKEDLGEFGIAPQGIRTREEFSKETDEKDRSGQLKRKLMQEHLAGPIPGVPVLEQLLRPVRDKVAVRILKNMGWKPGQGVGPRQTRKEKRQATVRNKREQYLLEHYGDEGLSSASQPKNNEDEENNEDADDVEDDDDDVTFAPNDYEPMFYTPKNNRFGMSYTGLNRASVLSKKSISAPMQHINLFGKLETKSKDKHLSIHGQAFGVGAFEEEDDDIYAKDDMTRYDFSLADKQPKQKKPEYVQQRHVIDGFCEDKSDVTNNKPFTIDLPRDFQPRNWLLRRSRFAPLDAERARKVAQETQHKRSGLGRHDLNPDQRAQFLGESAAKSNPFKAVSNKSLPEVRSSTKGGLTNSTGEEQPSAVIGQQSSTDASKSEQAITKTKSLVGLSKLSSSGFKPFLPDEAKQLRYEKFLAANLKDDAAITNFLAELQPVSLSLWDREMEKKEFVQASKIYRPLAGLMYDRFVSEGTVEAQKAEEPTDPAAEKAKIVMKRTKVMWKPSSTLCKRYNIAEPFGGDMPGAAKTDLKAKSKMSIFDYLETSLNTKANFQTPTIVPKHFDPSQKQQQQQQHQQQTEQAQQKGQPARQAEEKPPSSASKSTEPTACSVIIKPAFVPKTPLEQVVDASRNKPLSEKTDLFKRIFDDSDEEQEQEENPIEQKEEQTEKNAIMPTLGFASGSKITTAAAANLLRNNSPPRGIFAALLKPSERAPQPLETPKAKFAPIEGNKLKISFKSREERLKGDKNAAIEPAIEPAELYGPKLPSQLKQVSPDAKIDVKLQQVWQQHAPKKRKADEWVERTLASSSDDSDEDSSDSGSGDVKLKKCDSKKSHKKSKKSKHKLKKKSKKAEKTKKKSKKKKSKH